MHRQRSTPVSSQTKASFYASLLFSSVSEVSRRPGSDMLVNIFRPDFCVPSQYSQCLSLMSSMCVIVMRVWKRERESGQPGRGPGAQPSGQPTGQRGPGAQPGCGAGAPRSSKPRRESGSSAPGVLVVAHTARTAEARCGRAAEARCGWSGSFGGGFCQHFRVYEYYVLIIVRLNESMTKFVANAFSNQFLSIRCCSPICEWQN